MGPISRHAGDMITPTTSLEGPVDSVTVIKFQHQVRKELNKVISLEELKENTTINAQAQILNLQIEELPDWVYTRNEPSVSARCQ